MRRNGRNVTDVITDVDPVALRRGVLAVSVLDDVAVEATDAGAVLRASFVATEAVTVPWLRLARALDGADPGSTAGRLRLRDWLRVRAHLAAHGQGCGPDVLPMALPVGHAVHPGSSWVRERVPGGVLDIGLGLRLGPPGSQQVVPLAVGALACADVRSTPWWPVARTRLDELGWLAARRVERDGSSVLRPVGGCDVLTLLASAELRGPLARADGSGMRSVAAPMRSRGWFDLSRVDPAFVAAAAAATDDEHRGVARPLLVTAEEVGASPQRRTPAALAQIVLSDPSVDDPAWRRPAQLRR